MDFSSLLCQRFWTKMSSSKHCYRCRYDSKLYSYSVRNGLLRHRLWGKLLILGAEKWSDTQEILIRFMCLITSHWLMSPELVGVSISMRLILFLFSIASKIARTCRHHPTGCAGVDSEARLKFVFFARLLRPSLGSLLGTTPCLLLGRVELEETYCYSSQRSGDP